MKRNCPYCHSHSHHHSKTGFFVRRSDGRKFQRFRCKLCLKNFSEATFQRCYRQKKRRLNPRIFELLASGVSQRRLAFLLKISRTTITRKFLFLAHWAKIDNDRDRRKLALVHQVQFDDLETAEHSKCKPLSVTMFVEKDSRRILDFRVSRMPAKGRLAKIALKKYGPREDERPKNRDELFEALTGVIAPYALIQSDKNPHYPTCVKKWFPEAKHLTTRGRRGCVAGQGELKKVGNDPLFTLNHTFGMLRANINRLFRRTWCTTKKAERLAAHIELFVRFYNRELIS